MNPFFAAGQLFLLLTAPAAQEDMMFGRTWTNPSGQHVPYDYAAVPVAICNQPEALTSSGCHQILRPYNKNNGQFIAANAVVLHVKTKLTFPPTAGDKYCQIDMTFAPTPASLNGQNHAVHLEAWNKAFTEDRQIRYNTVIVPTVTEGLPQDIGKFTFSVRRQVIGNCQIDAAITLVGYYK